MEIQALEPEKNTVFQGFEKAVVNFKHFKDLY